jgi:hypothetical protein
MGGITIDAAVSTELAGMLHPECPYCKHVNPQASRFCNACGAPLYLLPCPDCGAVNDTGAKACHQCGAALPHSASRARVTAGVPALGAAIPVDGPDVDADLMAAVQDLHDRLARIEAEHTDQGPEQGSRPPRPRDGELNSSASLVSDAVAPGAAPAPAKPPLPRSRGFELPRGTWVLVGGLALLAGTVGGYYAFGRSQTGQLSNVPTAAGEVTQDRASGSDPQAPTASSEASPYPSLAGPLSAAAPGSPQASGPAAPISVVPPAEPPSAPRQSTPARQAESSLGITPPPPARLGPCTDAIAALGLCTLEPAQRKE